MTCGQVEDFFCQLIKALSWDLPRPRLVLDTTFTAWGGEASAPGDKHHAEALIRLSAGYLYRSPRALADLLLHELAHAALQLCRADASHAGQFCLLFAVFLARGSAADALKGNRPDLLPFCLGLYDAHESKIPAGAVLEWAQRTAPLAPAGAPVSELVEWAGAEIKQFWEAWSQRQAVRQHQQRRESHKLAAMASLSALVVLATLVASAVSFVLS